MKLEKHPDGSIHLHELGLKLEVQPQWLFKQSINRESQAILDELLEGKLKSALDDFISSPENDEDFRDKLYRKEEFSKRIALIAHIERDLIQKLHSDGECIELSEAQEEARSFSFSVWKFCSDYGYKSTMGLGDGK